jgi:sulfite reductase beta subunit-like hemoprotein
MLIAISGCPNGCAHSAVADVGAIGVVAGSAADRREAWNLLAGGERGQGPRLAQPVAGRVSLDEAAVKIVELAVQAAASGPAGRE